MSNFLAAAIATTKPPKPHQLVAWNFAWGLLSAKEQAEFLEKFRAVKSQWQPAVNLIREFEGLVLTAYSDPATGSEPWTIGWGCTTMLNGSPVKQGDTITQQDADKLLEILVTTKVIPALASTIPSWNSLPTNRQNALVSFAYNVGWHFYNSAGFETLSKCLHELNYDAVPDALMLYINPGSKAEAGLRRRRQAEAALWGAGS
jgi:lysozyme